MFNEERENVLIERLVRRQEKANEQILKELGKILGEIGQLTPSEAYTIGQQLKYGESLEKIIIILSKQSRLTRNEIYQMLEGEARYNLDFSKKYFKAREVDFIPFKDNRPLQRLVNEIAIATINNVGVSELRNISRTTGITYLDRNGNRVTKNIIDAYNEIVDDAIVNVATGKESFQQELQRQLKTIGQNGIQKIEYESGRHRRIDSALRMNLSDGLSQLAIAQQEIVGNQFGYNMVEVTHHVNAAPDHIDSIDGKQFAMIDILRQQILNGIEKDIKLTDIVGNRVKVKGVWYDDFNTINESLDRHVGTLNCRHTTMTGILGIDKPRYSKEELERDKENNLKGFDYENKHYSLYEGEQLLRKIELELRKTRETKILAQSSKEIETLNQMKQKENLLINKYYDILKVSGLKSKIERARIFTK